MKRKMSVIGAYLVLLLMCILGNTLSAKAEENVQMRMTVDNEHPLLISSVYGDPDETLWYGNSLTGAWDQIPDDVKPYSVIELHPGKVCQPTSCIPKDTPELRAWYIKMLDEAQKNNIPVMLVIMSAGERDTVPTSWLEEQFDNYSVLKGVMNIENYWIYNDDLPTHSADYIDVCAEKGAYFVWHDHMKNCWEKIMSNEKFYQACKAHKENVILTFKNTPISDDAGTDSIVNGFWLSDLCGNWGGAMDTWKWWEKHYTTAFAPAGGRDLRSYASEPEAMLGMEMMNIYANGGTVYNFECPAYTFASNDTATPAFTKVIVPFFRYTVQNPAPDKQQVLASTKIMFWGIDGGISQMQGFYTGLSSDDESMPLYDTGRYGIIPVIPAQITEKEIAEKFPDINIVTKKSPQLTEKVSYFNSKYAKMYEGSAFAQRRDDRWFVYNSNANVNENQQAYLPMYKNTCEELDIDMTAHTFAIVEESEDKVHIVLNNYRADKTELWERSGDWSTSWGAGEVNIANWVSESYAPNPQDSELRTTILTLKGHTGDDKPVITITGDEGHYEYTDSWDEKQHIYILTINHNGLVDVVMNARGEGPIPLPDPDEFEMENIALNKAASQSSTLYGAGSERAVDGNTNGDYGQGSVTHTDEEVNAWWKVDLGGLYEISDIQVYNRTDFCSDRLSDFNIQILDINENIVWASHQTSMPNPKVTVNTDCTIGRYVKIELNNTNNLSLAEVIVHGKTKNSE